MSFRLDFVLFVARQRPYEFLPNFQEGELSRFGRHDFGENPNIQRGLLFSDFFVKGSHHQKVVGAILI